MILYNVNEFKLTYKNERNGDHDVGFNFTRGKIGDRSFLEIGKIGDGSFLKIDINKKLGTPYIHCSMNLNESFVGKLFLQIELDEQIRTKDDKKFKHFISSEVISQLEIEKNFTIKCHGESFQFNESLLSMMSEVFKRMVHGNSNEAKSNCVVLAELLSEMRQLKTKI